MAGAKGALVVNIVADASKAVKAFKGTGDAGKDMADQLALAADRMERDLENTQKIADELAKHLGPKFKTTVGDNIDDIAKQFTRAGLKIEDVQGNMPGLVQGLKRVEDQADHTADQMTRIGSETDKSGSVMANFVGNSVQEIPGMTEAFGPLNMAVGQFAEYATEGDIDLQSLVKTGLGMGAVSVAFMGVNYLLGQMAADEKKVKEEAAGRLKVYNELSDKKYQDAAQTLLDTYKDQYDLFGAMGVSTSQMTKILTGDAKTIDAVKPKLLAAAQAYVDLQQKQGKMPQGHQANIQNVKSYYDSWVGTLENLAGAYVKTGAAQRTEQSQLGDISQALGWTADKTEELTTANKDAAAAVWDFYNAQLGLINLQLGSRGAERNYRRSLEEYNRINADGTATEDDKAEALDNVELAALALSDANRQVFASGGDVAAGAQAQIDTLSILAGTLAPGSELRRNLEGYISQLSRAAQVELLKAQLSQMSASGSFANYDRLLTQLQALQSQPNGYATGTMNAQAGLALVGENGPELIDFGGGERVYTAGQTGAILDGGGNSITINMPAGADGDDIVAALQRWVRRNGQLPLPVSSKTIR